MEGLCPCGHEPTGSIVPVSYLVSLNDDNDNELNDIRRIDDNKNDNKLVISIIISSSSSSSSSSSVCPAQGLVLHYKLRNQSRSSPQKKVFHSKLRNPG